MVPSTRVGSRRVVAIGDAALGRCQFRRRDRFEAWFTASVAEFVSSRSAMSNGTGIPLSATATGIACKRSFSSG